MNKEKPAATRVHSSLECGQHVEDHRTLTTPKGHVARPLSVFEQRAPCWLPLRLGRAGTLPPRSKVPYPVPTTRVEWWPPFSPQDRRAF